jgi:hypothetical protein
MSTMTVDGMGEALPGDRDEARMISARAIVWSLATAKVLLHLVTAGLYGFFIDELYFLACGQRLAWGYVDFPPLTAFQAWLARALFGDSAYAIRLFPALAGGALVLLTAALAREWGGGRFAQGLAALSLLTAPVYLAFSSYLSMNAVEPLIWMSCALLVVRLIKTGNTRLWLWFGLLAGLGLLNKHTVAVFCATLLAGLFFTDRKLMANRPFLLGGLIAFLVFLPNLVWMARHGFPHLELLANIRRSGRDMDLSLLQFLGLEALFLHPLAAPLWILGLCGLLLGRELKRFRGLGWAFLGCFVFFAASHGSHKAYYLAPAYPMLLAAGSIVLARWLQRPGRRWLGPAYAGLLAATGALLAPTVMPLLPPQAYLRYTERLGIAQPRLENRATNAMPQFFADRFGWPEMVETVARVYNALPPEERARTAIFANDYGQGGAVDFYGPRFGLPKAIGGHLTYWYWGPGRYTGESVIVLGDDRESLDRHFHDVVAVAQVGHPYAMRQEHFTVFLCRRPREWTSLAQAWPGLKQWD